MGNVIKIKVTVFNSYEIKVFVKKFILQKHLYGNEIYVYTPLSIPIVYCLKKRFWNKLKI